MTAPTEAPATGAETGTSTTTAAPTTAETPPDYKAMYEATLAERDDFESKYTAQRRVNRQIEQRYKNGQGRTDPATGQQPPAKPANDEATRAKAEADEAKFEAHLVRLAAGHSTEALGLLNQIDFREEVDELDFEDHADLKKQFLKLVEKRLGKTKQPPATSTSGGEFTGGSGATQPITEAQLKTMTPAQITAALEKGQLKHLL